MYSSILSNIALNGSKIQFYFPFFLPFFLGCYIWLGLSSNINHSFDLPPPPHSRGGGTYFCADLVSDDVSISVPLPPLPFLCECMISYEPIAGCLGISLG